ncbi:ABC transporter permease [Dysgonomonas sp. 216]|uniref:ABC transporter permease n=1 Tax=Dysgonomonas sp. 216 TaxID=2302934 RepID=UPI0013D38C62|nr:ABC transporter permease [Dysgonomonas sp. 216]NDW18341.1 ABC transporter permease [Dysgonomonas sp. 216]NDW18709.1 ABC transporter permease [Dysgonomonas sp. 216]
MKKRSVLDNIIYILVGFVLFNIIWFVCAELLQLKALPLPLDVYSGFGKALDNDIAGHLSASLSRVCIGLIISLMIAVLLGMSMGYNKKVNRLLGPLLYFTYPIPKLALLPIVMILFGVGESSKIIIIVLIIVFQLILSIRDAVLGIPKDDYGVLISLKASNIDRMRHITFPAILPEILSSLRVSLGIAMSALFFTETFGTDKGLGFYITDSWMRLDYIQMYFGIFTLSLAGFFIFLVLDIVESYTCKWKKL